MPVLDYLSANGLQLIVYAIGFVLAAMVPDWRVFRITAVIVVLALIWQFLTLFQLVPPQVTNLILVAALAPAWVGAAGALLVRAWQLQQPGLTQRTRVLTSAVGFVVFGVLAAILG